MHTFFRKLITLVGIPPMLDSVSNSKTWQGLANSLVVDGRENRDRLLGDIDTCENGSGLRDTRETLVEDLGWQMAELEVDVVLLGSDTAALTDLEGHRTRDDVTGRKVLGCWRVTLHEALALRVEEVTSLTTGT